MKTYKVIDFDAQEVPWDQVQPLMIDIFPWYEHGLKQLTFVKMALNQGAICIKVSCQDVHSSARVTEPNGSVYLDSCFEFFLSPRAVRGSKYLNFEINCCGTLHLAYGSDLEHRTLATQSQLDQVIIATSIPTRTKEESPMDQSWELSVTIPLHLIEEMTQQPLEGNLWYGNFYRCGGITEPQYATWNPVKWPHPAFHRPEQFGKLEIVNY